MHHSPEGRLSSLILTMVNPDSKRLINLSKDESCLRDLGSKLLERRDRHERGNFSCGCRRLSRGRRGASGAGPICNVFVYRILDGESLWLDPIINMDAYGLLQSRVVAHSSVHPD